MLITVIHNLIVESFPCDYFYLGMEMVHFQYKVLVIKVINMNLIIDMYLIFDCIILSWEECHSKWLSFLYNYRYLMFFYVMEFVPFQHEVIEVVNMKLISIYI
jgi:hypothetical protein